MEQADDGDVYAHPLRRWHRIQQLLREIWQRWMKEFVPPLNVLQRWVHKSRNIEAGDVVIMLEQGTPRANWPLARVESVFPGRDGLVRVVDAKVRGKVLRRPIHRLVPLEVDPLPAQNLVAATDVRSADVLTTQIN